MKIHLKEKLKEEVWRSDNYYFLAKKGSLDIYHPGMKILKNLSLNASKILDLGCGEGTRLNLISRDKEGWGIDISDTGIAMAKKFYPKKKFIKADLENIPLKDKNFDLVYSAYVLEHLDFPIKVLSEAIRLTKKDGSLVLIAPNYGSPNRSSPPFKGSRIKKLFLGFLTDLARLFVKSHELKWNRVNPIADNSKYELDWDTTVEPYLGTLLDFLKGKNLRIVQALSCWSEELPNAKLHQRIFRLLGEWDIYPFWLWGPHLVVVAKKYGR